ncbi:dolichol kinase [Babesia ovata]|uniref:Dolichol kinase n=1 Tax=Babesia ovata TaxID=189622 RepID=A0A2H6KD16_9APIC|nr:dolichol kinase [Babesia ovata]GBE60877.1 dolichol kinase [Babesia ovata]
MVACSLAVIVAIGLALRKFNRKKYDRMARLKVQLYDNIHKETLLYRMNSILPYLQTALLPLFLATELQGKGKTIAEALLFGAALSCVLDVFMFDSWALLICSIFVFHHSSQRFGVVLGHRALAMTVLQPLVHVLMRRDLTRSLNFTDSVLVSQLFTVGANLVCGGYKYTWWGPLTQLADFGFHAGCILLALVLVMLFEFAVESYPSSCIRRRLANVARTFVVGYAAYRAGLWAYTYNAYKNGLTPLQSLVKLFSTNDALITLAAWAVHTVVCVTILYLRSPLLTAASAHKHSAKSPCITLLRKGLHVVLLVNGFVAMYMGQVRHGYAKVTITQHTLFALCLYLIFIGGFALEILRFYGCIPGRLSRVLSNMYKAFGEGVTLRSLVVAHAFIALATGLPLWMQVGKGLQMDFTKAYIGLTTVAFADSLAAIVGSKAHKLVCHEKSIAGSLAFFAGAFVALAGALFIQHGAAIGYKHAGASMAVALAATIVEAGSPGTDNFGVAMIAYIVYSNLEKVLNL